MPQSPAEPLVRLRGLRSLGGPRPEVGWPHPATYPIPARSPPGGAHMSLEVSVGFGVLALPAKQ